MKSKYILLLALFWAFATNAAAMTITAGPATTASNGKHLLPITLSDMGETPIQSVAGTAFTLEFDTSALHLESVESDFFAPFEKQFAKAETQPMPEISPLQQSPVIWNEIDGTGAAISGARCIATSDTNALFRLSFTLKPGADTKAIYPIRIRPTQLNNEAAGYAPEGETIPILIGADSAQEPDTQEAYPVIIDDQATSATIQNGYISVIPDLVDTDQDGLDDNWEIKHFGDITTAGAKTDSDGDGIPDREEYLLNSNPQDTLPELSAVSSPCVANTTAQTLTLQGERLTLFPIKEIHLRHNTREITVPHTNIKAGTVNITIPKGLAAGDYTLDIIFSNGVGDGTFKVENSELRLSIYAPLNLSAKAVPTTAALDALDADSTHQDGTLTVKQLNTLGLGSLANRNDVCVKLITEAGKPRELQLLTETGVEMPGGIVPMQTRLLTPAEAPAGALSVEIQLSADTRITTGDQPYGGAINPPRAMYLPTEKKETLSNLLGTSDLLLFSAGNGVTTLKLSKPALVFLKVPVLNNAAPTIFYLDGNDAKKTLAGIDGSAKIDGTVMKIVKGGTVVKTVDKNGEKISTIAVLLDHFSTYAVGWSKEPESSKDSGDSGDSGGCFINTLRP